MSIRVYRSLALYVDLKIWYLDLKIWYMNLKVDRHGPSAPMNHVKYLRAGPAEMPFQNWYTANTNHFRLTDSVRWKSKRQLG